MKISAQLRNGSGRNEITLTTNDRSHAVSIAPKASGMGSSANGGEMLFLALATCYCNDIYREAAKRDIAIEQVEVEVTGEFGAEGEPARNISYKAKVWSSAPEAVVRELLTHTDRVAEVHNTLRAGAAVTLSGVEVVGA